MILSAERLEGRQRSYETYKQRILAGLSEAQREMGARDRCPLDRLADAPILLLHDGPRGIEEACGMSASFAIIYDLQDAHAWRQAHAHRRLWGRRFCQHYVLDEDHLLIVFMPGGDR